MHQSSRRLPGLRASVDRAHPSPAAGREEVSSRTGSAPSGSNVRQTMIGQVNDLVDRLDTVQGIANDRERVGTTGRGPLGGHSDPTSAGDRDQRLAGLVVAKFNQIRTLLIEASKDARILVPIVVGCCFWCGEPTKNRET